MRFIAQIICLALATPATCMQVAAQERTDVELVFLADASNSIDNAEILFQRQGYADAITDPQILSVIRSGAYGKIALTYVEWGSTESQEVVVPWTVIDDKASAEAFAKRLMAEPRRAFGRNAIGNAIAFAQALIETNEVEGFRKVIDLSADSANNWGGIPIQIARQNAIDAGIVINGLAVLCRACSGRPVSYDLERAFAETIIGGPGSFVITADGRDQFAAAVRRKLILELVEGDSDGPGRKNSRNGNMLAAVKD
jgi:uncharacterized protein YbaA (DUF1428 family)